jgi:CrcB protein
MGALGFLAVGVGATLGAWLRWALSVGLNNYVINLPLGTLIANLGGGYLIGFAVGFFQDFPELTPEIRLLVVTGFLGGLTTFSTFSAEAMMLLQRSQYLWAFTHTGLHLLGSIAFCIAGLATWRMIAG